VTNDTDSIIASLQQLGRSDFAAEPFVSSVHTRISTLDQPRRIRFRRRLRRVAVAFITALLALLPAPRTALAHFLGIGSVKIEHQQRPTKASLPTSLRDLDLGKQISPQQASRALGRPPVTLKDLEPIGIWSQSLTANPKLTIINSVFVNESFGVEAVLLSELPGPGNIFVSKKLASSTSNLDFFQVRGRDAVWISGAPHEVAMLTSKGEIANVPVRLAGNVLLWADDTRTIRIEGFNDRAAAVRFLERLKW
jgi:hypothetical protein